MNKERFNCIVTILNHYELTLTERQFVERVKDYFEKNGMLTEQQESILGGIHAEKIRQGKKTTQRERYIQV
jgi:hypothetical protein